MLLLIGDIDNDDMMMTIAMIMLMMMMMRMMVVLVVVVVVVVTIGTLRFDNGDVHETDFAEKQTSHHFKLFRDYPSSPRYLTEGDFGWSWREGNALKFRQRW